MSTYIVFDLDETIGYFTQFGIIWESIESHIDKPAKLYKIKLRETPTIFTEYYGPDNYGNK